MTRWWILNIHCPLLVTDDVRYKGTQFLVRGCVQMFSEALSRSVGHHRALYTPLQKLLIFCTLIHVYFLCQKMVDPPYNNILYNYRTLQGHNLDWRCLYEDILLSWHSCEPRDEDLSLLFTRDN